MSGKLSGSSVMIRSRILSVVLGEDSCRYNDIDVAILSCPEVRVFLRLLVSLSVTVRVCGVSVQGPSNPRM